MASKVAIVANRCRQRLNFFLLLLFLAIHQKRQDIYPLQIGCSHEIETQALKRIEASE